MIKKNNRLFGKIYKITNLINGKVYIGQTYCTLSERWSQHKCDSKRRHTAIANAIREYGDDNFRIEVIEDNIPYEALDIKEIQYIKEFNSICPNGYNMEDGGQAFRTDEYREKMSKRVSGENNPMYGMCGELNHFYGRKHSEETKLTIGKISKDRWENMSEEEYEKEIERLGEMNKKLIEMNGGGFKGKHHSEESKEKIKIKLRGKNFSDEHNRKISENSARKQRVVMLNKDTFEYIKEFTSMTKACIWLKDNGIHNKPKPGEISGVCRGKKRTAYGFRWVYYNDYVDGNYNKSKRNNGKKVICLINMEVFYSLELASEYAKVGCSGICACCNGRQKNAGKLDDGTNLIWMYYQDYLKINHHDIKA
ncbi:NUMOD3 domain-containing DNA-binding protein [Clostridium saccharoperbutylacetonicum]|uniref:NUMOD3 domain-containing DNA-binding protein n=1 Tax=Clostridium saccharoperbutylacetonicum TaxID=36745 RepID=UPI0039E85066